MPRPSGDVTPRPPAPVAGADDTEITHLLRAWASGDTAAGDRLFGLIYPQLRRLVSRRITMRRPGEFLQTTDLLHETYLRLAQQRRIDWSGRAHFFAIAATLARRVIVDHARNGSRQRRGAGALHLALDDVVLAAEAPRVDILALDRALTELASIQPTASRVVDLRYFGGLSLDETADALGLGRATAVRAWRFARSWLGQRLLAS
jgi:RNA polymerase sigma factor (TIGR02999 family)